MSTVQGCPLPHPTACHIAALPSPAPAPAPAAPAAPAPAPAASRLYSVLARRCSVVRSVVALRCSLVVCRLIVLAAAASGGRQRGSAAIDGVGGCGPSGGVAVSSWLQPVWAAYATHRRTGGGAQTRSERDR